MLKTLLWEFLKIGLCSFGGGYAVIPLIQEQVVDKQHWITVKEFTDIITISQMTPGPLAVNTSTFVGLQTGGVAGAILATLGCVAAGCLISLFLYRFFRKNRKSVYITEGFRGLKAASLGLILSAGASILLLAIFGISGTEGGGGTFTQFNPTAALIFGGSFILLRKCKIHPVLLMVLSGAAGAIAYL